MQSLRRLAGALALVLALSQGTGADDFLDIQVRYGQGQAGGVAVVFGDLHGRSIPDPVVTSVAFFARWLAGQHEPVPIFFAGAYGESSAVSLVPPVRHFRVVNEAAESATVEIRIFTLHRPAMTSAVIGRGIVSLQRREPGGPWRVTAVRHTVP